MDEAGNKYLFKRSRRVTLVNTCESLILFFGGAACFVNNAQAVIMYSHPRVAETINRGRGEVVGERYAEKITPVSVTRIRGIDYRLPNSSRFRSGEIDSSLALKFTIRSALHVRSIQIINFFFS